MRPAPARPRPVAPQDTWQHQFAEAARQKRHELEASISGRAHGSRPHTAHAQAGLRGSWVADEHSRSFQGADHLRWGGFGLPWPSREPGIDANEGEEDIAGMWRSSATEMLLGLRRSPLRRPSSALESVLAPRREPSASLLRPTSASSIRIAATRRHHTPRARTHEPEPSAAPEEEEDPEQGGPIPDLVEGSAYNLSFVEVTAKVYLQGAAHHEQGRQRAQQMGEELEALVLALATRQQAQRRRSQRRRRADGSPRRSRPATASAPIHATDGAAAPATEPLSPAGGSGGGSSTQPGTHQPQAGEALAQTAPAGAGGQGRRGLLPPMMVAPGKAIGKSAHARPSAPPRGAARLSPTGTQRAPPAAPQRSAPTDPSAGAAAAEATEAAPAAEAGDGGLALSAAAEAHRQQVQAEADAKAAAAHARAARRAADAALLQRRREEAEAARQAKREAEEREAAAKAKAAAKARQRQLQLMAAARASQEERRQRQAAKEAEERAQASRKAEEQRRTKLALRQQALERLAQRRQAAAEAAQARQAAADAAAAEEARQRAEAEERAREIASRRAARRAAARVIQAAVRGMLARDWLRLLRVDTAHRPALLRIQAAARGLAARRACRQGLVQLRAKQQARAARRAALKASNMKPRWAATPSDDERRSNSAGSAESSDEGDAERSADEADAEPGATGTDEQPGQRHSPAAAARRALERARHSVQQHRAAQHGANAPDEAGDGGGGREGELGAQRRPAVEPQPVAGPADRDRLVKPSAEQLALRAAVAQRGVPTSAQRLGPSGGEHRPPRPPRAGAPSRDRRQSAAEEAEAAAALLLAQSAHGSAQPHGGRRGGSAGEGGGAASGRGTSATPTNSRQASAAHITAAAAQPSERRQSGSGLSRRNSALSSGYGQQPVAQPGTPPGSHRRLSADGSSRRGSGSGDTFVQLRGGAPPPRPAARPPSEGAREGGWADGGENGRARESERAAEQQQSGAQPVLSAQPQVDGRSAARGGSPPSSRLHDAGAEEEEEQQQDEAEASGEEEGGQESSYGPSEQRWETLEDDDAHYSRWEQRRDDDDDAYERMPGTSYLSLEQMSDELRSEPSSLGGAAGEYY